MNISPQKLSELPKDPGVYIFKNTRGKILYIGKAKNLSSRVKSYFQKSTDLTESKRIMVSKVKSIDYILAPSESDAIFLEATLIKEYKPPYNIMLKDDKSWLYIQITKDALPVITTVRNPDFKKGKVFGPFTSARKVRSIIRILRNLFPYESCNITRQEPCLEYKLGSQIGPCRGCQNPDEYHKAIRGAIRFLNGNHTSTLKVLKFNMESAAKNQDFEQAAELRDQYRSLEMFVLDQQMIANKDENIDAFSIARAPQKTIVNILHIRSGKLISQNHFTLVADDEEKNPELLLYFIKQYYLGTSDFPHEVLVPFFSLAQSDELTSFFQKLPSKRKTSIQSPQKGRKKRLLLMSQKNSQHFLEKRISSWEDDTGFGNAASEELRTYLGIKKKLIRLEAYDISNIQGRHAVGSMVVFENGVPTKKHYRKFKIRTVFQANDFAMLQEVLARRLQKRNDWPIPDLFIIDGGKGQLSSVKKILDMKNIKTPVIGLAKKQEEVFVPEKSDPIIIPKDSYALKLLQRIRDEAHRFAITYHRGVRGTISITSSLDNIPGVGAQTRKKLIRTFGSVSGIKKASESSLASIVGGKLAKTIKERFS